MEYEFRNIQDNIEKQKVRELLSIENDMWYDDINFDDIKILVVLGKIIGCGRIITYPDHTFELGSVAVFKEYQGKGYGTLLIENLLQGYEKVYAICELSKKTLYSKFGFYFLDDDKLPEYIREKLFAERVRFPEDNSIAMIY